MSFGTGGLTFGLMLNFYTDALVRASDIGTKINRLRIQTVLMVFAESGGASQSRT